MTRILGGMQIAGTFEYQSGPLLGFSNRCYYGDLSNIRKDDPTLDTWFNTIGTACNQAPGPDTGWDRCSTRVPGTYQTRIFPNRLPGVRRDRTLQTNANVQKEMSVRGDGRVKFILRFDRNGDCRVTQDEIKAGSTPVQVGPKQPTRDRFHTN